MTILRYRIAAIFLRIGNALDSPHSRMCREARKRHDLARELKRLANQEFGNECARIAREGK